MRNLLFLTAIALSACGEKSRPAYDGALVQLQLELPGESFPQRTSLQLRARGLFSDGQKVDLTHEVGWASSDPEIVLVTNDGVAILRGVGTASITATFGAATQTRSLTSSAAKVTRLDLTPSDSGSVPKGEALSRHAIAYFDDGVRRDVTAVAQWSSRNANATMSEVPGEFVAALEGPATLGAYFGGQSAEQTITITGPLFEGLFIEAMSQTLRPGDLQRLSAAARYADGSAIFVTTECEWSSADPDVLSISGGVLTARAVGKTTVTAACGARSASREFFVFARFAESLVISDVLQLAKGLEGRVRVQARWDDGSMTEVTEQAQFSMSDARVATVSNSAGSRGLVRAVGAGTTQVRASFGEVFASVDVVAMPAALQSIASTMTAGRIVVNQRATFAVLGRFSDGSTMNLTSAVTFHGAPVTTGNDEAVFVGQTLGTMSLEAEVIGQVVRFPVEVTSSVITGVGVTRVAGIDRAGTERLKATATWSDGVETNVTEFAEWSTGDDTRAVARNNAGARGYVQSLGGGDVLVTCQLGADSATYNLSFPITP